jgi:predicted Zn-dependent protease
VPPPPSAEQILSLADRALAFAGPNAQVTAYWELRLQTHPQPQATHTLGVDFICLDRGIGRATTSETDDAGLRAAAEQARGGAAAGDGEPRTAELPEPATGRGHDGWNPAVLSLDPAIVARELGERAGGVAFRWRAGAGRSAVVSTAGVRAFEQRTFAVVTFSDAGDRRTVTESAVAVAHGDLDIDRALSRIATLRATGPLGIADPEPTPVVLGPAAVAVVLALVGPHFGSLAVGGRSAVAERLGRRVVAPCINLSDSPRVPGTLPRSYDAEGLPRRPLPLVQDGVAHRVVRDTASPGGPSTGHATVALRAAPEVQHLVLVGGGAADEDELMLALERGLFVPTLTPDGRHAAGLFAIEGGRRAQPLADAAVEVDGLEALAGAQALTMGQQTIATGDSSARTIGASVCPALRTTAGVTIAG